MSVYKDENKLGYHISAPIVTGPTGGTENAPFTSHVINVNLSSLTDFEEEPEQVGVGVGLDFAMVIVHTIVYSLIKSYIKENFFFKECGK